VYLVYVSSIYVCSFILTITVDPMNKATLDIIERAQFILHLDPAHPGVDPESPVTAKQLGIVSNRFIHGNSSAECSCNRWYDHGIQVPILLPVM